MLIQKRSQPLGVFAGVTIDFRDLPERGWYDQVEDVKDAVRWVRANAERYNIDPDRIGANRDAPRLYRHSRVRVEAAGGAGVRPSRNETVRQSSSAR